MKKFKKLVAFAFSGALVLAAVVVFADEPQTAADQYHHESQEPAKETTEKSIEKPVPEPVEKSKEKPVVTPAATPVETPDPEAAATPEPILTETPVADYVENPTPEIAETPAADYVEDFTVEYHNGSVYEAYDEPEIPEEAAQPAPEVQQFIDKVTIPNFLSFTGVVTDINPVMGADGRPAFQQHYVRLQNQEYGTTIFRTDENTFTLGTLEVGDTATGFYSSDSPSALIYPPQHLARVIVNNGGNFENVRVDRFFLDKDRYILMSQSHELMLKFTEATPIKDQDGRTFYVPEGSALLNELDGRMLVVTHGPIDRILPASTSPSDPTLSITVLRSEEELYPQVTEDAQPLSTESQETSYTDWSLNEGISVNNQLLKATWQQFNDTAYVPFRAIVDALGFGETIHWNSDNQMITVNNGKNNIVFPPSARHFIVDSEVVTLDYPTILQDGTTYVPWQFFKDVFGANADFIEGQVFVDKKMSAQ